MPDNRPTPIAGKINGHLADSDLRIVEGVCRLAPEATTSFVRLLQTARAAGVGLKPNECYRPAAAQTAAKSKACGKGNCACAAGTGTSNHGWGKAVDLEDQHGSITSFASPTFAWLTTNAGRFGWNHPAALDPGHPCPEAWHWEWVGDGGLLHASPVHADAVALIPAAKGYRIEIGDGAVTPPQMIAFTPRLGWWIATPVGRVFAAGDARDLGSLPQPPSMPVVSITATATGRGYWLLTANGGVFAFGDAPFAGTL